MNEEEKQVQPISDARKTALLRYMAVLFVVAFILVALSLVLQTKNSQTTILALNEASSSAVSNAERLQEQNRELQEKTQQLEQQIQDLEQRLEEQEQVRLNLEQECARLTEQLQQKQEQADAQQEDLNLTLARTQEAYEALLVAMSCETHEGNVTFSKAVQQLELLKPYLSTNAMIEYEKLLEY